MENNIWSCRHKNFIHKHTIVVKILDKDIAEVLVNTYDNFFDKKIKLENLIFDYCFK